MSRNDMRIHWHKLGLALLGSVLLDISASLVSHSNFKETIMHAAVIALSVAGSFFMDAYKKVSDKPRPKTK